MKNLSETFTATDETGKTYTIRKTANARSTTYLDGTTEEYLDLPKLTHEGKPVNHIRDDIFYIVDLDTEVKKIV